MTAVAAKRFTMDADTALKTVAEGGLAGAITIVALQVPTAEIALALSVASGTVALIYKGGQWVQLVVDRLKLLSLAIKRIDRRVMRLEKAAGLERDDEQDLDDDEEIHR